MTLIQRWYKLNIANITYTTSLIPHFAASITTNQYDYECSWVGKYIVNFVNNFRQIVNKIVKTWPAFLICVQLLFSACIPVSYLWNICLELWDENFCAACNKDCKQATTLWYFQIYGRNVEKYRQIMDCYNCVNCAVCIINIEAFTFMLEHYLLELGGKDCTGSTPSSSTCS